MTLLRKEHSEGTSYLELAQFLRAQGDAAHVDADLAQLFRRVAFNVAVGNRDDHLRNHGFVLGETGADINLTEGAFSAHAEFRASQAASKPTR